MKIRERVQKLFMECALFFFHWSEFLNSFNMTVSTAKMIRIVRRSKRQIVQKQ